MKMNAAILGTVAVAALLTFGMGAAHGDIIQNGGFESPNGTGDAIDNFDFDSWVEVGNVRMDEDDGGRVPGSNPNQVARFFQTSSLTQDLGTNWAAADTYDLSFNASETWWRTGAGGDSIEVKLLQTDDTELWSSGVINLDGLHTGTAMPAWTAGQTFNYSIDASSFTAGTPGEELRIQIARAGGVSQVDNVSLTVIPEPASLGLLGVGGLLMLRRK